jgi:hypothetical protein
MTAAFFATNRAEALKRDIVEIIHARDQATPRHLQRALGPSEIAHPCMRRLAYGLMEVDKPNPSFDPLPAIIGTATHKWLESAAMYANTQLGRQRWHTETRVNVTSWLSGSCDLYDADTATVIDYKVPGASRFTAYKKQMSEVYRQQVHLYGKGFRNANLSVEVVAVMLIPRGGTLSNAHLWSEPYDESIADAIIYRRHQAAALIHDFDVEHQPDHYEWFSRSGPDCMFCPWFSPNPDSALKCGGIDI